ncbi:BLUF domain-containing protein [Sphingomonas glacialis]|uniref:BLUF domain-containing protein n=1 Tax=Sphingomonas glacialis TaxID=658225 RepID=A0A502FB08_9SPHN|nr:BLUF domain-containing protein [Sphingomonas glacialis]TPG46567.1 BLUF domain-containing protein [Sphingomonas glacialis]
MTDPLYMLAYFSRNAVDNQDLSSLNKEIEAILHTARESNRQRGITGALLYSSGCFAQVLEGPLSEVESTFERIQLDPRHRDVALIQHQPIPSRSFADWSMAFAGIDPDAPERAQIDEVLADPDKITAEADGLTFVSVLRQLIGRHELHQV